MSTRSIFFDLGFYGLRIPAASRSCVALRFPRLAGCGAQTNPKRGRTHLKRFRGMPLESVRIPDRRRARAIADFPSPVYALCHERQPYRLTVLGLALVSAVGQREIAGLARRIRACRSFEGRPSLAEAAETHGGWWALFSSVTVARRYHVLISSASEYCREDLTPRSAPPVLEFDARDVR